MTATDAEIGTKIDRSFRREGSKIVHRLDTPAGSFETTRRVADTDGELASAWMKGYLTGARTSLVGDKALSVRTVELFCGPGGLGLGFSEACRALGTRMESEAAADIDDGAVSVYAANHGTKIRSVVSASELVDRPIQGQAEEAKFFRTPEVCDEAWRPLVGRIDAVLAGPPCQGHSNLNNHSRRTDKRNELYLTVPAIAVALEADMVVIENVPAVVHDSSRVVASTEQLLRSAGYEVESGVLSAALMGWPQTRKRFFMVGRRSAPPIPIAEVQSALAEQARSVMWAIEELGELPFDDRLHFIAEMSDENRARIEVLFEQGVHDLPLEFRPDCHKDGTTYNAVYGRMYGDRPAPTLTTGFLTPGRGRYIHPTRHRTLTPWEAARIQGFPDSYNFIPDPSNRPTKAKLTKWIGDAVPMPLGYAAGIALLGNGWSR